jgi:hypothetical protein
MNRGGIVFIRKGMDQNYNIGRKLFHNGLTTFNRPLELPVV